MRRTLATTAALGALLALGFPAASPAAGTHCTNPSCTLMVVNLV